MTPRFLFPARRVTENPSVWIRHLNYSFHRASLTIYLQYAEFHTLSCYPVTLTWNTLENWKLVRLTFWVQNSPWGCYRRSGDSACPPRTPGDAPYGSAFLSEGYGQREKQKALMLTAWRTAGCYPAPLCLLWGQAGTGKCPLEWRGLDVILRDCQEETYFLSPSIFMLSVYTDFMDSDNVPQ